MSDPSLDDISAVLNPVFTEHQVKSLSSPQIFSKPSYDLSSRPYTPGYIGLNNIKANDYLNVVIHSLLHVAPLRDYLLLKTFTGKESELFRRFAGLAKKLWNPRLFKSQVSPHEFLQEVRRASNGKFKITEQGDPVEFIGWLLNQLHRDMSGSKKRNSCKYAHQQPYYVPHVIESAIIYSTFQGEVRIETQQVLVKADLDSDARPYFNIGRGEH